MIMKMVFVTVSEDISVDDYLTRFNQVNNVPKDLQLTYAAFLDLKVNPLAKYNNGDLIRLRYDPDESQKVERIKAGTVICLPVPLIKVNVADPINSGGYLRQSTNIKAYFTESMKALMSSDGYTKAETLVVGAHRSTIDAQIQNLNIRVWIYSKVIDELIDISPLVSACSTNKGFGVGSFSIAVSPSRDFKDLIVREGGVNLTEVINQFNIIDNKGGSTESFLSSILQENDLVFIRFERLNLERDNIYTKGDINQFIKKSALANPFHFADIEKINSPVKIWDMIGLIDTVSFNYVAEGANAQETIIGRDFTKLLMEDGAYFFPWIYMQGSSLFYAGSPTNEKSGQFKRNYLTGEILDKYLTKGLRSIRETLLFVIDNLSNIGVVKDDVFESYGTRKRTAQPVHGITGKVRGVWQIVNLFVENILNQRRLTGDLGSIQGTMMDFFNRACQKPFVEFWGDTWGDTFDIIVRQPPFTKSAVYSVVDMKGGYITIENKDLLSYDLSFNNTCFSQYQLNIDNYLSSSSGSWGSAIVPVVLFPVIAETFGNKRIIISDSYINIDCTKGVDKQDSINNTIQVMINDLVYVIETTIYLPFTRQGRIVLNGDRRIKVGTFIRLEATDELYYVTNVRQTTTLSGNLMRTTEIQVERGMRFDLIKGETVDGKKSKYSYFDLVDTDLMKEGLVEYSKNRNNEENLILFSGQQSAINRAAWEYFMKRRYLNIQKEDGDRG